MTSFVDFFGFNATFLNNTQNGFQMIFAAMTEHNTEFYSSDGIHGGSTEVKCQLTSDLFTEPLRECCSLIKQRVKTRLVQSY